MSTTTVATNLWTTFGVKYPGQTDAGIRENIQDQLTNIDPDDTPTVSILPKTTADNLFVTWMLDALTATSTSPAAEGAEFSADNLFARTRLDNWIQRFRKDFALSQDQIELAKRGGMIGVHDAMAHEAGRASREILRNINVRLWSNSAALTSGAAITEMGYVTGGASPSVTAPTSTTAGQMRNIRYFGQYVPWTNPGTTETAVTGGVTVTVNGPIATAGLFDLHESMYMYGITPDTLVVSPGVKRDLSRLLLNDTSLGLVRNTDAVKGESYAPVVEIIRTDFGKIAVLVDRWMPQASVTGVQANAPWQSAAYALIDKSRIRLAYWRNLKPYSLPPSGDNMRAFMLAALTVQVTHPRAVGLGLGVTT